MDWEALLPTLSLSKWMCDLNRLVRRSVNQEVERFGYDWRGRLSNWVNETTGAEISRIFDAFGRIRRETQAIQLSDAELRPGGSDVGRLVIQESVQYTYRSDGQVDLTVLPGFEGVKNVFNDGGTVDAVIQGDVQRVADTQKAITSASSGNANFLVQYDRDSSGRVHREEIGNGVLEAALDWDTSACGRDCLAGIRFHNAQGGLVDGHAYTRNNDETIRAIEERFYSA